MTRKEKRAFIRTLSGNIVHDVLKRVPDMPDDWDGIQLRRYLAMKFQESVMGREGDRKFWRDFENEVLVRNL